MELRDSTEGSEGLEQQCAAALSAYIDDGGETHLSRAYELGRQALQDGLGILDVATLYSHALDLLARTPGMARPRAAQATTEFVRELLSPFEMSLRGYQEANTELRRLNEELKRQQDAVEAANDELRAFSYAVSHDLRAPLLHIDGFIQVLLEDHNAQLDAAGQKHLHVVRDAARLMDRRIEGLLALTQATCCELRHSQIDLSACAREVVERLRTVSPTRVVNCVIEPGVGAVGDDRLLGVVIENLLVNAWKYSARRADARIEFGQQCRDGQTVYFVRDNGAGFDMAFYGVLFGVFHRLHSTKDFEGTGIGLATVKRIVQRHGGRVWGEGAVDQGATFYFTLGAGDGKD